MNVASGSENVMNRERRKRYKRLREIRQERDYNSGTLQFANRPYSFRTVKPDWTNGKSIPVYVTTNQFIQKNNISI